MEIGAYERNEWSRMARAAYRVGKNDVGHRYSAAASVPNGYRFLLSRWDELMAGYRQWLVSNEWPEIKPIN
jgi:hypothetical protein